MKPVLTINLSSIAANYNLLRQTAPRSTVAAVVKADAYGLGAKHIALHLKKNGCEHFFVATLDEAIELRNILGDKSHIYVLYGPAKNQLAEFKNYHLTPVLNTQWQIKLWKEWYQNEKLSQPAIIHLDTGMNRLGVTSREIESIRPYLVFPISHFISHLSSADQISGLTNRKQLQVLQNMLFLLERINTPISLAASSGIFLGSSYHFNMVRPGIALWGGNPTLDRKNPMQQVVTIKAPIIQIKQVYRGDKIGYDGTYILRNKGRIATIAIGYADGVLRTLSNCGYVEYNGFTLPIVGRVSMDLITIDISRLGDEIINPMDYVELVGLYQSVDKMAKRAGTISYEILTSLGNRYQRMYIS